MNVNNKNEEEIPPVTVKTDEEYAEIVEKLRWRPTFHKIAQFSIADLLRAENVEDTQFFRFKNIDFKTVKVRGTVVDGVKDMVTRLSITVDDGTGQIDCIWQINEKLKVLNEKVNKAFNVLNGDLENEIDKGTNILLYRCKSKLRVVPTQNNDIKVGDTVVLVGNLSDFNENRIVYINYISITENCDPSTEIQYLIKIFGPQYKHSTLLPNFLPGRISLL